jgi:DNA (cytosine-5)-methyltransferase 1
MIKVGSDFSGVGAFNQALMRLGIEYDEVFACDMDKYARETFIHNYGEPKYYPKDVYDREIPKESLDIYMTSPPCQAFSLAGKRLGKDDKRGVLFFNSHEFIKKNKPRYFIFENVKGLLSDDNGNTFKEWVNMLGGKSVNGLPVLFPYEDSVPYHIYYKVMNAKKHGVPQNRERVFIIGIRDDKDNHFRWAKEEHLTKRLKDVLINNVDEKYILSKKMLEKITFETKKNGEIANLNKGGERGAVYSINSNYMSCLSATDYKQPKQILVNQLNKSKESGGVQPYQQNRVYDVNGINPALNAGQETWGGNIINTQQIRRLTPRECFRLMDFPNTFTWICKDSQAYKQAGNSIVVRCLELIIKQFNL